MATVLLDVRGMQSGLRPLIFAFYSAMNRALHTAFCRY